MSRRRVWMEISLLEHWGPKPHGIPRVSQNVFLQSLRKTDVQHFFYDRQLNKFVIPRNVEYFVALAAGKISWETDAPPVGDDLADHLGIEDRVLFSEVGWDHPQYLTAVQALRRQFATAVFHYLLCDLIPIKFPHFFDFEFGERARSFMRALPSFCDRYVCISESTARDVHALLAAHADTRAFKLGSDVHSGTERSVATRTHSKPYVLSVGTLEIRKNHILLYFVWRRLAEALGERCPELILVGRPGWIAGDVYTLFQTDPMVNKLVRIRHDVTDEQLADLIRGCEFSVFPSFYEGWGLPASESLYYGKVCVTSNTSSLPEINPCPELMFDPYNHMEAYEVIRSLIEHPEKVRSYEHQIARRYKAQTWDDSFDDLHAIVEA